MVHCLIGTMLAASIQTGSYATITSVTTNTISKVSSILHLHNSNLDQLSVQQTFVQMAEEIEKQGQSPDTIISKVANEIERDPKGLASNSVILLVMRQQQEPGSLDSLLTQIANMISQGAPVPQIIVDVVTQSEHIAASINFVASEIVSRTGSDPEITKELVAQANLETLMRGGDPDTFNKRNLDALLAAEGGDEPSRIALVWKDWSEKKKSAQYDNEVSESLQAFVFAIIRGEDPEEAATKSIGKLYESLGQAAMSQGADQQTGGVIPIIPIPLGEEAADASEDTEDTGDFGPIDPGESPGPVIDPGESPGPVAQAQPEINNPNSGLEKRQPDLRLSANPQQDDGPNREDSESESNGEDSESESNGEDSESESNGEESQEQEEESEGSSD